jgi:hypothetical protein
MRNLLNRAINRWLELSIGQKKTLWLVAFLSPVLPFLTEILMDFIDPARPRLFSTPELFVCGWAAAFLPLIVIVLLAKLCRSNP